MEHLPPLWITEGETVAGRLLATGVRNSMTEGLEGGRSEAVRRRRKLQERAVKCSAAREMTKTPIGAPRTSERNSA